MTGVKKCNMLHSKHLATSTTYILDACNVVYLHEIFIITVFFYITETSFPPLWGFETFKHYQFYLIV